MLDQLCIGGVIHGHHVPLTVHELLNFEQELTCFEHVSIRLGQDGDQVVEHDDVAHVDMKNKQCHVLQLIIIAETLIGVGCVDTVEHGDDRVYEGTERSSVDVLEQSGVNEGHTYDVEPQKNDERSSFDQHCFQSQNQLGHFFVHGQE